MAVQKIILSADNQTLNVTYRNLFLNIYCDRYYGVKKYFTIVKNIK